MRRIISVLLENEAGALSRVVGLFAQRNFNIETLTVAPTDDTTMSRMTISTAGDGRTVEQITKQLNKLIEVIRVVELTEFDYVERELMLVKVHADGAAREEVKRMADIFRAQIVDVGASSYTVQVVGPMEKLDAFLAALSKSSILEVVRSGVSGIARGERILGI